MIIFDQFLFTVQIILINIKGWFVTLPAPCIPESCIKIKTKVNFYFCISLWCLKRFYEGLKAFKAFIKPFDVPRASVKIVNFLSRPGIVTGRVNVFFLKVISTYNHIVR